MARPHGSKNQKTLDWESFGKEMIEGGLPRLHSIMKTCDDQEFIRLYLPLLEYFKPKLKRIDTGNSESVTSRIVVVWDEAPDDQTMR